MLLINRRAVMPKTLNKPIVFAILLALISAVFVTALSRTDALTSPNSNTCTSSIYLTQPYEGQTISGQTIFEVYVPNTLNAQQVVFLLNDNVVGGGTKFDQNWRLPFDTVSYPNGSYNLTAEVSFDTTTYTCSTLGRNVIIDNGQNTPSLNTFTIEAVPNIAGWTGPTNVTIGFKVRVYSVSGSNRKEVTTTSAYNWQTNIGTLSPAGSEANFFSGPRTGDGQIKVDIAYSGKTQTIIFPIHVKPASDTTIYPNSTTATATAEPKSTSIISSPEQTLNPEMIQQGDIELKTCLKKTLASNENIQDQTETRLKFSEIDRADECFARRKFIIPSNLAPIAPDKVRQIKEDKSRLAINKISSEINSSNQAIILSGKAHPNKTVIIYIFSEPLVLAAKTDDQGRWSYTLEDPLEPGNHEAYVTVEGDKPDEAVRSSGFGFAIASAPQTKENPFGLSLLIQDRRDPKSVYIMYILGAGSILSAAIAIIVFINWKHKSKTMLDMSTNTINASE